MRFCCFTLRLLLLTVQAVMRDVQGHLIDTAQLLLNKENTVGPDTERGPRGETYRHTAEPQASQFPEKLVFDTRPTQPYGRTQVTKDITAPPNRETSISRNAPNSPTSKTENLSHVRIHTESEIPLITNYEKTVLSSPQAAFESMMNGTAEPQIHLSADATKASVWLHTLLDNSSQRNTDSVALTSADRGPRFPVLSASHPHVIDNLAALLINDDDKQSPSADKKGISVQETVENGQSIFHNDTTEDSVRGSVLTKLCLTCPGNRTEMSTEKSVSLAVLSQTGSSDSMGTQQPVLEFNQFTTSLQSSVEETQTNKVTFPQNNTEHARGTQLSLYTSQTENYGQSFPNNSQIQSFPIEIHTTESDSLSLAEMSAATPANTVKQNYITETFATERAIYLSSKSLYTVRKPEKDAEQESSMVPPSKRMRLGKNNKNASHSLSINAQKDQALNFTNNKGVVTEKREGLHHITLSHLTTTPRLMEAQDPIRPFSSMRQFLDASSLIHTLGSKTIAKPSSQTNGMGLLGGNSAVKPASDDPNVDMSATQSSLTLSFVDSRGAAAVNKRHTQKIDESVMPLTESRKGFDFNVLSTPTTKKVFSQRPTIRKLSASQSKTATDGFLTSHSSDAIKQSLTDGVNDGYRNVLNTDGKAAEGKKGSKIQGETTQKWMEKEKGKFEREEVFLFEQSNMVIMNVEEAEEDRKIKVKTKIWKGKGGSIETTREEAVKQGKGPEREKMDEETIIEGINKTNMGDFIKDNETNVEKKHFTIECAEDRGEETLSKEDIKNKVESGKEDMTNVPPGPTTKSKELNRDKGHTAANLSSCHSLIKKLGVPEHKDIHWVAQIVEIKNKQFSYKVTSNHRPLYSGVTSPRSQQSEMTTQRTTDLLDTPKKTSHVSYIPLMTGTLKLMRTRASEASVVNSTVSITSTPRVITAGLSSYQPQFTVNTSALDTSIIHRALDHGNKSDNAPTSLSAEREPTGPNKPLHTFESSVKVSLTLLVFETVNISRPQQQIYNESAHAPPTAAALSAQVRVSIGQAQAHQGHSRPEIQRPLSSSSDMTASQPCSFKLSGKMAHSDALHASVDENELRSAQTLMVSMSPKAKNNKFPLIGMSQLLNLTLFRGETSSSTYGLSGLTISAVEKETSRGNSGAEYANSNNSHSDMTNKSTEHDSEQTTDATVRSNVFTSQNAANILENSSSPFIAQVISQSVYRANTVDRLNSYLTHMANIEVKDSNESSHGDMIVRDTHNKTNTSMTNDQRNHIFQLDNDRDINSTSMFAIHTAHNTELAGNEDFVPVMNGFVIPVLDKNDQAGTSAFVESDSLPTIPANDVTNNAISDVETQAGQITGILQGSFTPAATLPAGHSRFDLQVHNMSLQQASEQIDSIPSAFQITTTEMDDYVSLAGSASKKAHIVSTDANESVLSTSETVRVVTENSSGAAHGRHIFQSNTHIEPFSVIQPSMTHTSSKHTPAVQRNNSGGMKTETVKLPEDEMSVQTIEHSWPAVHSMITITRLLNNPNRDIQAALLKHTISAEEDYSSLLSLQTSLTTQTSSAQHDGTTLPVHMPNQLVAVTNSSPPTELSPTEMINKSSCKVFGCAVADENTETIIGARKIDGSAQEQMFETQSGTEREHSNATHTLDSEEELDNCSSGCSLPGNTRPWPTTDNTKLLLDSQSDPGRTTAADTTQKTAKTMTKTYSGPVDSEDLKGHVIPQSTGGATQRHPHISIAQGLSTTEMNAFKPAATTAHTNERNTKKASKGQTLAGHHGIRSVKEERRLQESVPKLLLKPAPESIKDRRQTLPYQYLTGVSEVSDDVCGSGNYTAEMSLTLGRAVEPGDAVPALGHLRVVINLKTNNSWVNLQVTSCCLSPTVQGNSNTSTCCLFSRLPAEPSGFTLLPSALSSSASFTISLSRMINYSMAYLHCDLNVCLRNHSHCERPCLQQRNLSPLEDPDVFVANLRNRISFGPMLKEVKNSTFPEEIEASELDLVLVVVSLAVGFSLVSVMLLLVWLAYRRRAMWPIVSAATPRACCVCPPRQEGDDLILP